MRTWNRLRTLPVRVAFLSLPHFRSSCTVALHGRRSAGGKSRRYTKTETALNDTGSAEYTVDGSSRRCRARGVARRVRGPFSSSRPRGRPTSARKWPRTSRFDSSSRYCSRSQKYRGYATVIGSSGYRIRRSGRTGAPPSFQRKKGDRNNNFKGLGLQSRPTTQSHGEVRRVVKSTWNPAKSAKSMR